MADSTIHIRTCPLCEATCGLELRVEAGEVTRTRGDADDVFSAGFICPKGTTLGHLHADPDRLRQPLIRSGPPEDEASWREVSWDEAYAAIAQGIGDVIEAHGRDGVAAYLGNPNVHNLAGALFMRPLLKALGTINIFSASTVDQMPKHVSSGLLFGSANAMPVPDLDRTDMLVMLGANPLVSGGSLATAPDFGGRMAKIRERGGHIVVIDPRRTKTAEAADVHHPIVPGTDGHLLLAWIHVLLRDGLVDTGRLGAHMSGVDELAPLVAPFTPERAAAITGISADEIVALAHRSAAADSCAVYGRIGVHTTAHGTIAAWAVDVIAALTGNLDEPGGHMFSCGAHTRPTKGSPGGRGYQVGRWASRVRGLGEANGELPAATFADELLTPGAGQVKALVTVAGNPAMSLPDSDRIAEGLAGLDFMVSVDIYRNETTRFANVILPPPSALEREHYDMAFANLSVRNVANWSPAVFETDAPSEAEILARLALAVGGAGADADPATIDELVLGTLIEAELTRPGGVLEGRDRGEIEDALVAESVEGRCVEVLVRTGPYGDGFGRDPDGLTMTKLLENPHGVDLGPLEPRLPGILKTVSGTVELVSDTIAAEIARLDAADLGPVGGDAGSLLLIGRRHVRSNNSWMHNIRTLTKGKDRCTLQMNPGDAGALGLADGSAATITSRVGSVTAPVEVTDSLMVGVVSLPHGWGHDAPGARLANAAARPGVNANVLVDPGPVDTASGNATLNGIPVTVSVA